MFSTQRKIQNGKSLIKCQNQKLKHIKRMNNNCHIPDLIQALSFVGKWCIGPGFRAEPLTCMTVASNFIIVTTMLEVKMSKIQQSTLCYNLQLGNKEAQNVIQTKYISKIAKTSIHNDVMYKYNVTKKHKKVYRQGTQQK